MTQLLARRPALDSQLAMSRVAAVAALVAGLLIGMQDASAGNIIHIGPRRWAKTGATTPLAVVEEGLGVVGRFRNCAAKFTEPTGSGARSGEMPEPAAGR